jgi:hypothetical protein
MNNKDLNCEVICNNSTSFIQCITEHEENCGNCIYEDNFTYESPCSHCNHNPKYYDCYQHKEL